MVGLCTSNAVCLSVCLSVYLSVCLSVYLSCLSVWLAVWLSVCLSLCLPVCLSVCLPACLSICLSVCLSVCLYVCLSVYCVTFVGITEGAKRARTYFAFTQNSLFIPGCVHGAIISLVCLSVFLCLCVTFVVFTDCESCTRPIFTNPGSMESGEYELLRGMCFVVRRLEVVAVAGLLWISWCVAGAAEFISNS